MKNDSSRTKRTILSLSMVVCIFALTGGLLSIFYPYSRLDVFRSEFRPTNWQKSEDASGLRLLLVDENGTPVEGAFVGDILSGNYSNSVPLDGQSPSQRFNGQAINMSENQYAVLRFLMSTPLPQSNADGVVEIPREALMAAQPGWQSNRPHVLYALHSGRGLGGLACYRPRDLGSVAKITLMPLCRVRGTVVRADGQSVSSAKTLAFWGPMQPWRIMPAEHSSNHGRIDLLLPPGKYTFRTAYLERDADGVLWTVQDIQKAEIRDSADIVELDMVLKRAKRPARIAGD